MTKYKQDNFAFVEVEVFFFLNSLYFAGSLLRVS